MPTFTRSTLSIAVAALALAGASAHAAPDPAVTHRFEQVVHEFYERYLATHPEEATQLGDHRFDGRSGDQSAAGVAADRKLYRKTLDVLQAMPASSLPPDDAVDREILEVDLRARLYDIEVLKTYTWSATDYAPTQGLYVLLARDYAPMKPRLAAVKLRLQALPKVLAAAKQNLRHPPRVYTETAIAQNKGAIGFVQDELDDYIKQAPEMKAALAPARARAVAALKDYGNWLQNDLLPRSDGDFRFGKEHFEQRLKFSLDSNLGAADILALAQADMVATQKTMEETALPLYRQWFPDKPVDGLDGHALVRAVLGKIASTGFIDGSCFRKSSRSSCTNEIAPLFCAIAVSVNTRGGFFRFSRAAFTMAGIASSRALAAARRCFNGAKSRATSRYTELPARLV